MLHENLKRLREEKGLTQGDIGDATKTTTKTVMNWESGKTEPKVSELLAMSKKLGTTVNELIGEKETKQQHIIERISNAIDDFSDSEIESLMIMIEGLYLRNQSNKARANFSG